MQSNLTVSRGRKMTNLLQRISSITSGMVGQSSYSEVIEVLKTLRDTSSKVSIQIEGDKTVYSSAITAFNAKHRVFVLDNFTPHAPTVAFTKGRKFTVSISTEDQTISLAGIYIEPLMANCDMGHQLQIPARLEITGKEHEFDYTLAHIASIRHNTVINSRTVF